MGYLKTLILALAVALGLTQLANAQGWPKAFKCQFTSGVVTEVEGGSVNTGPAKRTLQSTIASIDLKKGTAQFIGNAGAETVHAFPGGDFIHFLEFTATGNLNVTTVFADRVVVDAPPIPPGFVLESGGDFFAVHSRHISISGPIVSHYHGACRGLW